MPITDPGDLAAMLDLLVYENVLLVWCQRSPGRYEIVSHDGEPLTLSAAQAHMWALGAFATFLAFVDHRRVTPRVPGRNGRPGV